MSHSDHHESKTLHKPTSAVEAYDRAQEDIANLLGLLTAQLEPRRGEIQWVHVGSLQHVRETLIETLAFLSGYSTDEIERELHGFTR